MARIEHLYVKEYDIPDYILVGSISRYSDDDLLKYVPERTCKLGTNVMGVSRCSECNSFVGEKDNYCPNCGAKVVE